MNKKQIKDIFRKHKVQINKDAMEMILVEMNKKVESIALRCNNGNIKRLTSDLFYMVK